MNRRAGEIRRALRQNGKEPCAGGTFGNLWPRITSEIRPWLRPKRAATWCWYSFRTPTKNFMWAAISGEIGGEGVRFIAFGLSAKCDENRIDLQSPECKILVLAATIHSRFRRG